MTYEYPIQSCEEWATRFAQNFNNSENNCPITSNVFRGVAGNEKKV